MPDLPPSDAVPPENSAQPRTVPYARGAAAFDWRGLFRRLGPAGPLAIISSTLPAIGGFTLLFLLNLLGPWLKEHGATGVLIYVLCYAGLSGAALLPTYAQAALGGWAFGFAIGFPAALGGVLGGAMLGYALGRWAAGDRVVGLIEEHRRWKAVHAELVGSGFWRTLLIVTLVRLPPSSPFAITNLVLSATRVRPLAYGLGTLLGLAPRTGAAVFIAAGVKELTFDQAGNKWMWIIGIALTLIVVLIIGQMAARAVARLGTADTAASSVGPPRTTEP